MMTLLAFVLTTLSLAQPAGSARDIAERALRLEIDRDRLAVPPDDLTQMFRDACASGYRLACERNTWIEDGEPVPKLVRDAFRPSCDANDGLACMAWAWGMIQLADAPDQSEDTRDATYREVIQRQRDMCDNRQDASACKDVGDLIYDEKGLTIADPVTGSSIYLNQSCDGGEYAACARVARLVLDGKAVKTTRNSAYDYVKPACNADYLDGCFLIAQINQGEWDIGKRDTVYGALCDGGHVESCYTLGRGYVSGEFPEPSPGRAQELFEKSCSLMHARSCYEAGKGEQDLMETEEFYRRACDLDDAAGCKGLVDGLLEWGQPEVVANNFKAFQKTCDQQQSEKACEWLAYHLLQPDSAEGNPSEGRKLLEDICLNERSSPKACLELGRCLENGTGGSRDRTDAVKYYRWACQNRVVEACNLAGQLLAQDDGVRQDDAEALVLLGQACVGSLAESCTKAGDLLRYSVQIPRDAAQAAEWFNKGCDQQSGASCLGLGEVRQLGINDKFDLSGARIAYQRAIDAGNVKAKARLAYMLWNTLGGKKDKKRARQLVREACQQGFDDACEGVEKLTGPGGPGHH